MNLAVIFGLATSGSAAAVVAAWMLVRLWAYRPAHPSSVHDSVQPSETGAFSLARYRPMARLLAEDDFLFLAAQPGYRPEVGAKLRRERRHIFRLYLRELACDFHRIHAGARALVAQSGDQHAELVGLLVRQQVTFWRSVAVIELRLLAQGAGLGKVEVWGLVEAVDTMRRELARFAGPALA
jgi:hypothetical protein